MKLFGPVAVAATVALVFSGAAFAGPNWTYVDANFYMVDAAIDDSDNMAFGLAGSFGFADFGHLGLSYRDGDIEVVPNSCLDYGGFEFNLGAHPHLTDKTDLLIDLVYVEYEGEFNRVPGEISIVGYGIDTGVRSMITDKFELNAIGSWLRGRVRNSITPFPTQDFNEITVALGGQYYVSRSFAVGVVYTINDPIATTFSTTISNTPPPRTTDNCLNCDSLTFNLRWNFR